MTRHPPFQRLLEQPYEEKLEEHRVKMAALALKDATLLVEQKERMDQTVPFFKLL